MIQSILFVGDASWPMYVRAFYCAARRIPGCRAELFDYGSLNILGDHSWSERIEIKFSIGIHVAGINRNLLKKALEERYEVVFFYSDRFVRPSTVSKLKESGAIICSYCNDDPFSTYFPAFFWRNFRAAIRYSDLLYAYRKKNIGDYQTEGAADVRMLRAYYIRERNYYISDEEIQEEVPEIVFLGHREDDERISYIRALADADVRIGLTEREFFGVYPKNVNNIILLKDAHEKYNLYLNKAKIAVVFLSKINADTYTRRCFEIPAVKTMMMAPYTEDLASMYEEDKEIVFYRSCEEFVRKVKYYLAHEEEREEIGLAGYERLMRDGHEAEDRVRQILTDCAGILEKRVDSRK